MFDYLSRIVILINFLVYVYGAYGYSRKHTTNWYFYAFIASTVVLVGLASVWIKRKYQIRIAKYQINKDKERLGSIPANTELDKVIPSNRLLARWSALLLLKAKNWATDAQESNSNFYIDIDSAGAFKYTLQNQYTSKWKNNEEITLYEGALTTRSVKDPFYPALPHKFFYRKFRDWGKATLKAYEQVNSELTAPFQISLHSGNELSIWFKYERNDKEHILRFTYDGADLVNEKTQARTKP